MRAYRKQWGLLISHELIMFYAGYSMLNKRSVLE